MPGRDPLHHDTLDLPGGVAIVSLRGEQTSHLILYQGRSLLIDCHSRHMARWLERRSLPAPERILHTHVQPEHCREGGQFPQAAIFVPEPLAELAGDPEGYRAAAHTVWDDPPAWPRTMGREKYGVAGCVTQFPPESPLMLAGTFQAGEVIDWRGLTLEVVALPAHTPHAVGFRLLKGSQPLAFFTGDLFQHGPRLVNVYDLEVCYGSTRLPEVPTLLRQAAELGPDLFLPATGPAMPDGPRQARTLAHHIDAYHQALRWQSGLFQAAPQPEYPRLGRYLQLAEGLYQITGGGNCILFIDDRGRGMMVDPGPCDYENPNRPAAFLADLDLFEQQAGLKAIDLALITHMHGDHYDLYPLLKQRYPACELAAWDLVARVLESPWDYPYACRLPWYNMGPDHVRVDHMLTRGRPFHWHETPITSVHLPGHCNAHAAYLLPWRGRRVALTGDTIQSYGGSSSLFYIIANDSVPGGPEGCLEAFRTMTRHPVDLNVGGHGSHFVGCNPAYEESVRRMEYALPFLRALVPGGDLKAAFRRPSFPRLEPVD